MGEGTELVVVPAEHLEHRLHLRRVVERGGHFPMLEVPGVYVDELRRAFGAMPW